MNTSVTIGHEYFWILTKIFKTESYTWSLAKTIPSAKTKLHVIAAIIEITTVKVVNLTNFGAFVQLEKGVEGLVHISQICEKKIAKPEDELKVSQKVNAKIIELDKENKKIELSIRDLEGTSNEYKEEKIAK